MIELRLQNCRAVRSNVRRPVIESGNQLIVCCCLRHGPPSLAGIPRMKLPNRREYWCFSGFATFKELEVIATGHVLKKFPRIHRLSSVSLVRIYTPLCLPGQQRTARDARGYTRTYLKIPDCYRSAINEE